MIFNQLLIDLTIHKWIKQSLLCLPSLATNIFFEQQHLLDFKLKWHAWAVWVCLYSRFCF